MCPLIKNPLTLETSMVADLSEDGKQLQPKTAAPGESAKPVDREDKKLEKLKKKFLMTVRCLAVGMLVLMAGYGYWYFIGSWRVRSTELDDNPFSQHNIERNSYLALYSYEQSLPNQKPLRKQTYLQKIFCGKPTSRERSAFCQ